jgi:hypothetical protein
MPGTHRADHTSSAGGSLREPATGAWSAQPPRISTEERPLTCWCLPGTGDGTSGMRPPMTPPALISRDSGARQTRQNRTGILIFEGGHNFRPHLCARLDHRPAGLGPRLVFTCAQRWIDGLDPREGTITPALQCGAAGLIRPVRQVLGRLQRTAFAVEVLARTLRLEAALLGDVRRDGLPARPLSTPSMLRIRRSRRIARGWRAR